MKQIKLNKLELINFKGIQSFVLDTNGSNVNVFGDNATGKTTLFDAFTWVLFDKDSTDSNKFQLKTVNDDGSEQHHLDHSVSASFLVDDHPIELKKVYYEKWTKKRGGTTEEFSGHTTDYFVNGVPSKKKEYDETVSNLVSGNENLFKLITSPTYFNEQLSWEQRRKVLLNVCGDISDEDVIAGDKKLEALPEILGNHSIDDYRKILAAKRKQINQELDRLPIRIDEATKSKPDLNGQSEESLRKSAENLQKQIETIDEKISTIRSGGEIDVKRNEIRKVEGLQLEMRNSFQSDVHKKIDSKRSLYYDLKAQIDNNLRKAADGKDRIKTNEIRISRFADQRESLLTEWAAINKREFEFSGDTTCPACGQELPADKIEEAKEHALKHFNLQKSRDLEENKRRGMSVKQQVDELKSENGQLTAETEAIESQAKAAQPDLDALKKEVDDLSAGVKSIMDDPEFQKTQQQVRNLESEIRDLQASTDDALMEVSGKKQTLKQQLSGVETDLLKFDSVRRIDKRIAELEAQEKDFAKAFEQTEYELNLTDVFVRTKVDLLEQRINGKFKMARFKLFQEQINGGLKEVCETTYRGVPYSSMNNAAKINVGLDIIQTLSEFYELSAPIFIDNRESVVRLPEVNSQIIGLVVSEQDKTLRTSNKKVVFKTYVPSGEATYEEV